MARKSAKQELADLKAKIAIEKMVAGFAKDVYFAIIDKGENLTVNIMSQIAVILDMDLHIQFKDKPND